MRITALSQEQFTLGSDPALPMQAATKRYVDNQLANLANNLSKDAVVVPGTGEVNVSATDYFVVNVPNDAVITLTPTQVTSLNGHPAFLVFDIQSGENSSVIWDFPNIEYNRGMEVALTPEGRDIVGVFTRDGGTSWVMVSIATDVGPSA